MAIPKYDDMYIALLEALKDGEVHDKHDIKAHIKEAYNLSDEEMAIKIPSGKMTLIGNRIGWCKTYLKKAGLIENSKRNQYQITEEGLKVLEEEHEGIDNEYLMKYEGFRDFINTSKQKSEEITEPQINSGSEDTPQELIAKAMTEIEKQLADELMDMIMQKDPSFFEQLVIDLLEKIGYGGKVENPGHVTQYVGDGGIDGVIKEDVLGFDKIYVQAKRWNKDHAVGSPDIQQFIGALATHGASKGLFITTSRFSSGALDVLKKDLGKRIVLVDGNELTSLMIKYGLGVSVEKVYEIKHIDSDYFAGDDE